MFLALQVLLLLLGAGLSVFNVRLGLAVWIALTAQFVSFMWMTLPQRQFPLQAAVFASLYGVSAVGLAWSRARLRWWHLPATTAGVLCLLRGTMWLYWLAGAPISGVSLATLWQSTVALVVPAVLALLVGHAAIALLRRGSAKA
ncbi:MAG: hypothetical protein SF187_18810 [Deltaproteobacteria bacterium]|nr:hypothetical protein [Deltaproteobacteria bacterium]